MDGNHRTGDPGCSQREAQLADEVRRLGGLLEKIRHFSGELDRINSLIHSALDFDEIMQQVVVETARGVGAESAVIYMPEAERWVPRYTYGMPREEVDGALAETEVRYSVWACRERRTVVIDDALNDERADRQTNERYGIRALIDAAIMVGEDMIGDFSLHYHTPGRTFSDLEIDFVNRVAASLGLALKNAILFRERSQAEQALRETEMYFRCLSESGIFGIAYFELDGRVVGANGPWLSLVGFTREELDRGEIRWDRLTPPEWMGRTLAAMEELEATGRMAPYEKEYLRKDGTRFWGLFAGTKLDGRSEAMAITIDITGRKSAEQWMAREKGLGDCLNGINSLLMSTHDADTIIEKSIAEAAVCIGADMVTVAMFQAGEWIIRYVHNLSRDMLGASFPMEELRAFTLVRRTGRTYVCPDVEADRQLNRRLAGEHGARSLLIVPLISRGEVFGVLGYGWRKTGFTPAGDIDFTEKVAASASLALENARLFSEAEKLTLRLNGIISSITDAYFVLDQEWRLVEINEHAERLFGRPAAGLLGKVFWEEFPRVVGSEFHRHYLAAMQENRPVHFEGRSRINDRWHEVHAYPRDGLLEVYYRDITERKEAEEALRQTLAELARSNRELEQFAYVASHDLQEPLRMISGYMGLLQRKYADMLDDKARQYIGFAVDGTTRMQKLVEGLLGYSRISQGAAFGPVDAAAACRAAIDNLQAAVKEAEAVVTTDTLPTVWGDEIQILQLLQNLIGNALKYRRADAPPRIHLSCSREEADWVFSVSDNGIGIEPRFFDRIFQVFQRLHTQDEYPGTGIGLASCKKIVERHGGRIWVESTPGKGTTFFFSIPAREDQTEG
ncbi:ATP-binding protein [Geobacter sp. DSM 9736]|uniref:ATP-binding protein n=1 Tax=Geobacter sp. DSM 9736 TaxID=1277350 RepID=UPI000B513DE5|nr:ATP-binding protein [Geobacter sp. DSM 9736]SNB44749.1 PAS domain S-box-containing protein [Geobacter sp. DSM 9736]